MLKIPKSKLEKLYWKKKFPLSKIAEKYGMTAEGIRNKMIYFNIPRRKVKIYPKKPFSGNLKEKSYLLGLRAGDIYAKKIYNRVIVETTSPRLSQMKMFNGAFKKYGTVIIYEKKGGLTAKTNRIYCALDKTFQFLTNKPKQIPQWIIKNKNLFYHFLAGYVDSEGSWIITEHKKYNGRWKDLIFSLGSCDKKILEQIQQKLRQSGFNSHKYLVCKKGVYGAKLYNFDFFRVMITNHDDVAKLAKILLPLSKHEDKRRKMLGIIDYRLKSIKKKLIKKENLGTTKILCIRCGNKKVWKNGFSKYKNKKYQRYKCPRCRKEFQKVVRVA